MQLTKALRFAIPAALMLAMAACASDAAQKNPADKTDQAAGEAPPPVASDVRPAVYLDGLYATSSEPGQDVAALFDNNDATGWRTQTGAGPDEGIMLYFSDRQQVNVAAVQVDAADGSFAGDDSHIQIYVNGQLDNSGKANSKITLEPLKSGEALRSLFVRFAATGKEQTGKPHTDGEEKTVVKTFPADAFVALKQISLLNATGQPLRVVPPRRVPGKVLATSTLKPESAYSAANLFDGRKEFVWAEGVASSGEGETLAFEFSQPVNITAIQIWNGYQRSASHYSSNARVRNFDFGERGGAAKTYTLADRSAKGGSQRIELSPAVRGQNFELKIRDIFKGSKYKDLAISEIVFFDGAQPFTVGSDLPARYEQELRTAAAGSPLAAVLNRRIFNDTEFASMTEQQSLILRSDGTFVMYNQADDEGISSETLADGNWELQEASADKAKIKVFGKWYDFTTMQEYYKGNSEKEATKIFSDVLTVDAEKIKGGKMLGTFWIK